MPLVCHKKHWPCAYILPGMPMAQASLTAQWVKNSPAVRETQETWVPSVGQDSLEKEMATQSCILAWEIPWTEEPGGLQFKGSQRVRHN